MAKGNNALLIFDFDNTITNGHMHGVFSGRYSEIKKSDYNSAAEDAVTDDDIGKFLKDTGGIKNKEKLKSVLQSAISNGIEVNIASFTGYPNAVKRVVESHLDLSKEKAGNVSIFGHFPKHYDSKLPKGNHREQFGKNLHICKAIMEYKNKHDELPKTVMLVDDDENNINKVNEFVKSMSEREGWLKENGLSIEDIQKIKFEGVQVPEDKNVGYLERVQEFIDANLGQEPIYENLKEEEPIYQNLQDIKRSSFQEKPPQLPPEKRKLNKVHTDSGVAVNGKNKEQVYTQNFSSREQTEADHRYYILLDLKTEMQKLHISLQKDHFSKEAIDVICSLFKEKVISAIRERGDEVTENGENEFTIESADHYGDYSKITVDSRTQIMAQVEEKKKEIKDFASNYKGEDPQLSKKISELLNVNPQKTDINSNYVTINQSEGQQAAASPRRYIKVIQDKNIGSNPTGIDKREKGKKTDLGSKILSYIPGKTAFSKIKETQELSKRDIEVSDPNHSSKSHVTSEGEPKAKGQVEAELKRRANAASQEQSVGR